MRDFVDRACGDSLLARFDSCVNYPDRELIELSSMHIGGAGPPKLFR